MSEMTQNVLLSVMNAFSGAQRRMAIRRNGRGDGESDALRFPEQREEHQQRKHNGLDEDGDDERAAANAAFASPLLRVAFDQAPAQGTKTLFLNCSRNFSRLEQPHTPPKFFASVRWAPRGQTTGSRRNLAA